MVLVPVRSVRRYRRSTSRSGAARDVRGVEGLHEQGVARPASLDGFTVGLLDISRARGDIFLDEVERLLAADGVASRRPPTHLREPSESRLLSELRWPTPVCPR